MCVIFQIIGDSIVTVTVSYIRSESLQHCSVVMVTVIVTSYSSVICAVIIQLGDAVTHIEVMKIIKERLIVMIILYDLRRCQ